MGTRYIWKKSEVQTEYPLKSEQKTSLLLGSKDSIADKGYTVSKSIKSYVTDS